MNQPYLAFMFTILFVTCGANFSWGKIPNSISPKEINTSSIHDLRFKEIYDDQLKLMKKLNIMASHQNNAQLAQMLQQAVLQMNEVSQRLSDGKADAETLALQTTIIEQLYTLVSAKGEEGEAGSALTSLESSFRKNEKKESSSSSSSNQPNNKNNKNDFKKNIALSEIEKSQSSFTQHRSLSKTGGGINIDIPEEFSTTMDRYNKILDERLQESTIDSSQKASILESPHKDESKKQIPEH